MTPQEFDPGVKGGEEGLERRATLAVTFLCFFFAIYL
jgi:hypothetical protein